MEKISQTAFKNLLANNENILITAYRVKSFDGLLEKIDEYCPNLDKVQTWRKCTRQQTNALKFDDGNNLYFDDISLLKEYYKKENILAAFITHTKEYKIFMLYAIKKGE